MKVISGALKLSAIKLLVIIFGFLLGNSICFAQHNIQIDPGEYKGLWAISKIQGFSSGPRTVSLDSGRFALFVGSVGYMFFEVDTNGQVISLNPIAATASGNKLTLNTVKTVIHPQEFEANWIISRASELLQGKHTLSLVPTMRYLIFVGGGNQALFSFTIDAQGQVNSLNGVAASGDELSLTFNNVEVTITPDPLGSTNWYIAGLGSDYIVSSVGEETLVLVPGLTYVLITGGGQTSFFVDFPCHVDPDQIDYGLFVFTISCGAPDRDSDGYNDDVDNCSEVYNPDQRDYDLDLIGDACDSDIDGDGVENSLDACSMTPLNDAIHPSGCNLQQYLQLRCLTEGEYKNHGQYISCITQEKREILAYKLISNTEFGDLISIRAKNK